VNCAHKQLELTDVHHSIALALIDAGYHAEAKALMGGFIDAEAFKERCQTYLELFKFTCPAMVAYMKLAGLV
jgi:hypothetical protein